MKTRRALGFALAFSVAWALVEVIAGGVLARYSPYQVVWARYGVHLLVLCLAFGWRGSGALVRTKRPIYQIGRSLLMLVMPASWIVGRELGMRTGDFMQIFWLSPLLVMLFATWLLRERVPLKYWLAAILACAGVMLEFGAGLPVVSWRLALPVAMACSFSLYIVMTRSLRDESVLANLFYTALGVFVTLTPLMYGVWTAPAATDLLAMVVVGVLGLAGLYFLDRMASAAPVSFTAPLLAAQVLIMTILSVLPERQLPGKLAMLGMLAVAVSAVTVWYATGDAERGNIGQPNDLRGRI